VRSPRKRLRSERRRTMGVVGRSRLSCSGGVLLLLVSFSATAAAISSHRVEHPDSDDTSFYTAASGDSFEATLGGDHAPARKQRRMPAAFSRSIVAARDLSKRFSRRRRSCELIKLLFSPGEEPDNLARFHGDIGLAQADIAQHIITRIGGFGRSRRRRETRIAKFRGCVSEFVKAHRQNGDSSRPLWPKSEEVGRVMRMLYMDLPDEFSAVVTVLGSKNPFAAEGLRLSTCLQFEELCQTTSFVGPWQESLLARWAPQCLAVLRREVAESAFVAQYDEAVHEQAQAEEAEVHKRGRQVGISEPHPFAEQTWFEASS